MIAKSQVLQRLDRLLSSAALRLGTNRVSDHEIQTFRLGEVHVYVAHLESLASETNELLLLETSATFQLDLLPEISGETFFAINELVRTYGAAKVWYVANAWAGIHKVGLPPTAAFDLSVVGPAEFFAQIFSFPKTFAETAMSDVDLNGYPFKKAFQPRIASTLSRQGRGAQLSDVAALDTELAEWANSDSDELPLLLLGDRGSGKSWQLLKFCQDQYNRSKDSPGVSPPAVYINLKRAIEYLRNPQRSSLGLFGLLSEQCPWFKVKWNATMLQGLLECKELILCFDGLDEIEVQPSEADAHDHLRRIVSMLPMGSRFIITSRTTNFASFEELFSLETWPENDVEGTFRVLELAPFLPNNLTAYTVSIADANPERHDLDRLKSILGSAGNSDELTKALQRCCRQPALLARIVHEVQTKPSITVLELLRSAIEGALVDFNLQFERTRPLHIDGKGQLRNFDTRARLEFLAEVAWFMAERRLTNIDINHLPARLSEMFGIDTDTLRRDIRSQTVFELVENSELPQKYDSSSERGGEVGDTAAYVRFGLRHDLFAPITGTESPAHSSRGPGVYYQPQSASHSYFLASYIVSRLSDSSNVPGIQLEDTLSFLGRVRLDCLTADIIKQKFETGTACAYTLAEIAQRSTRYISELARRGGCQVFTRALRYLFDNLQLLGCIGVEYRTLVEPWSSELCHITDCPVALEGYEFVLVPSPSSPKIAQRVNAIGAVVRSDPFLLGVHEITNKQFQRFILTPTGDEWSVEKVTRARSGGEATLPSRYASKTNEYSLYFWEEASGRFQPPQKFLRHPVVYVSWYMAQAFCNWLSEEDMKNPVWPQQDGILTSPTATNVALSGFRLPTAAEWWWSAQGLHDNADFPWELLPYFAPGITGENDSAPSESEGTGLGTARDWFQRYQDSAKRVILDSGRRGSEVAYDDDVGPFGAIGLIGNVKEWVQDIVSESNAQKSVVCGTTAHLGVDSFRIGYYATFFPENSNPDVGFRLARSLSPSELLALRQRETELCHLPHSMVGGVPDQSFTTQRQSTIKELIK